MAIIFTQGDTALLRFTANDAAGVPYNLSGATFSTQIKGPNGVIAVFPNAQHTITLASAGTFTLSLSATDTINCGVGSNKEIVTQITIGAAIVYFRSGRVLTVNPNIPLQ